MKSSKEVLAHLRRKPPPSSAPAVENSFDKVYENIARIIDEQRDRKTQYEKEAQENLVYLATLKETELNKTPTTFDELEKRLVRDASLLQSQNWEGIYRCFVRHKKEAMREGVPYYEKICVANALKEIKKIAKEKPAIATDDLPNSLKQISTWKMLLNHIVTSKTLLGLGDERKMLIDFFHHKRKQYPSLSSNYEQEEKNVHSTLREVYELRNILSFQLKHQHALNKTTLAAITKIIDDLKSNPALHALTNRLDAYKELSVAVTQKIQKDLTARRDFFKGSPYDFEVCFHEAVTALAVSERHYASYMRELENELAKVTYGRGFLTMLNDDIVLYRGHQKLHSEAIFQMTLRVQNTIQEVESQQEEVSKPHQSRSVLIRKSG